MEVLVDGQVDHLAVGAWPRQTGSQSPETAGNQTGSVKTGDLFQIGC